MAPLKSYLFALLAYACPLASALAQSESADDIAVIITGWGSPHGTSKAYNEYLVWRNSGGVLVTLPDQPCSDWHVGEYPYKMELGRLSYAQAQKVKGFEELWDSYGIYRLSEDGQTYISLIDPENTHSVADLDGVEIIEMKDVRSRSGGLAYAPDPRDGSDYLQGIYRIGQANGMHDYLESDTVYWMRVGGLMGWDPNVPAYLPEGAKKEYEYLSDYVGNHFSDNVEILQGKYAPADGLRAHLPDTVVDVAGRGLRKLVLAKPITDHNLYANFYWDKALTLQGLCRANFDVDDFSIEQVRQLGRTPEYNHMVVNELAPHFDTIAPGSEVSIIYATYGLPWPGGDPAEVPRTSSQPWIKETFHENAFLNFRSAKEAIVRAYDDSSGGAYRLNFNKPESINPNSRVDSLYAYAMYDGPNLGRPYDLLAYTNIRDNLDELLWEDNPEDVIILLSHWHGIAPITAVTLRAVNNIPLNTKEEIENRVLTLTWCELYSGPGDYEQQLAENNQCPEGWTRLQITDAFQDLSKDYAAAFSSRIRGGVERFGVFPDLDIEIAAEGSITKLSGGEVAVTEGPLKGARLDVHPDPKPAEPESRTWDKAFRSDKDEGTPYMEADAIRGVNVRDAREDFLDSAKDDFTAYIGTQTKSDPDTELPSREDAASPAVYVGPYRTLFNAPATVTLPYDPTKVEDPSLLRAFIFNDLSGDYEPVDPVPSGQPVRVDEAARTASFDVQTLGVFVLDTE